MHQKEQELRELLKVMETRNNQFMMPKSNASECIKFHLHSQKSIDHLYESLLNEENQTLLEFTENMQKSIEIIKKIFSKSPELAKKYIRLGKWYYDYGERFTHYDIASNYFDNIKYTRNVFSPLMANCPWEVLPEKIMEAMVDITFNIKHKEVVYDQGTTRLNYNFQNLKSFISSAIENDQKMRDIFNDRVADAIVEKYVEDDKDVEINNISFKQFEAYSAELSSYF